jgi:flagellar hook assembly protein FlgD
VATLSFGLPRDGEVEIGIVDVQGRQVRNLHRGSMASGPHTLVWDGRSSSGQSSAPGIYFAVLRFSNETRTQRIVRVP